MSRKEYDILTSVHEQVLRMRDRRAAVYLGASRTKGWQTGWDECIQEVLDILLKAIPQEEWIKNNAPKAPKQNL